MIGLDIPGLKLTKVDDAGVPRLVQRLVCDGWTRLYRIELFDGSEVVVAWEMAEDMYGDMHLFDYGRATILVETWLEQKTIQLPGVAFEKFLHGLLYPNCR